MPLVHMLPQENGFLQGENGESKTVCPAICLHGRRLGNKISNHKYSIIEFFLIKDVLWWESFENCPLLKNCSYVCVFNCGRGQLVLFSHHVGLGDQTQVIGLDDKHLHP